MRLSRTSAREDEGTDTPAPHGDGGEVSAILDLHEAAEKWEMMHTHYSRPPDDASIEILNLMPALWEEMREYDGQRLCDEYLGEKGETVDMEHEQALDELCAMDSEERATQLGRLQPGDELPSGVVIREYDASDFDEEQWTATDDVHQNRPIDLKKLREARREEMEFVRDLAVYRYRWRKDMIAERRSPVRVRWVDQDKGERFRARLCAMEFKRKTEATWFAGTPPLESLRLLASMLATRRRRNGEATCMMTLDVKRAHFHAPASRQVFVELPPEDALAGRGDVVGELQASMYGTRDAAFNWEAAYSSEMLKLGFLRGKASANHYFHPVTKVRALVHGDDFALVGLEKDLRGFEGDFRRLYPCTVSLIGPDEQHDKALKILGREIRYATTGIEMEVYTKYLKQALQAYGMEECHAAASPATKEEHEGHEDRRELLRRRAEEEGKAGIRKSVEANGRIRGARLSTSAETTFRSVTALINFILPD